MKLIGRDDRGNPIWRPDDWEEPKEKKTEPQEQKATRVKLEKVK